MTLEEDLYKEILKLSNRIGIKTKSNYTLDKLLINYLTVRSKLIDAIPREIKFSPSFFFELQNHPKREIIRKISLSIKEGFDVNHFQSERLQETNFHDHLRNEWNIFHFHLSDKTNLKTGHIKRSNELLFVYIDNIQAIFLGVDKHRLGVFADTKWIEILHKEFPDVIAHHKKTDDDEIYYPKLNAIERQDLWNRGISMIYTEIGNDTYISPGLGRTMSGHSSQVIRTSLKILRWLKQLNKQINECKDELDILLNTSCEFKLKVNSNIEIWETSKDIWILTFPNILITKNEMQNKIDNTAYNSQ